jgi:hypothetical protein
MVADDPAVSERRALPYAGRQAATEDKKDELATRHQNNEQRPAIHFYSRRPVQPRFKTAGIDGQKPYVRPEDTVLFGYRWPDSESIARPSDPMKSFPLDAIRYADHNL